MNSKAYGISPLSDSPNAQHFKVRWVKMLEVCYVTHFRVVEMLKKGLDEHIPHMPSLMIDDGTKNAHIPSIVGCILGLPEFGCADSIDEDTQLPAMPKKTWARLNNRLDKMVQNFTNNLPSNDET